MQPAKLLDKDTSSQDSLWLAGILIILISAFALRLYGLSSRALWFDESIEYWMAAVPLSQIHQAVAEATHDPPFYSYFLHVWQMIGLQEFWLRMPSLYVSILSIAGIISLSTLTFDRTTAIFAGILFAVSTADIRYAQEVGQYSLMVCLLTFNLLFLYQTTKRKGWYPWLLWGITALFSIYSHYGSAIIVFTTATTFMLYNLLQHDWNAVKKQITVGVITIILTLPLILIIILQQLGRLGASQLPVNWNQFLSISSKIISFQWLGNQMFLGWPWLQIPTWLGWLPVVVAVIVALSKSKSVISPPILLVISWLGYYFIGRTGAYFFTPTRHSLLIAPLLILSAANGIAILYRWRKLSAIIVLIPILIISLAVPREGQEDLRSTARYWLEHQQANEATYIFYGAAPGFQYQLDVINQSISTLPRHWYINCWGEATPEYCVDNDIYYGRWTREFSPTERVDSLMDRIGEESNRVWIVFSHAKPGEGNELIEALDPKFRIITEQSFDGASLFLLEKR